MTAPETLSPKELRSLRARAHALKPTVHIASAGLSEGVLRELDRTLAAHELIKIHAAVADRAQRAELLETLCRALAAHPVQMIGKMLVAYRPRIETRSEDTPAPKPAARARRAAPATKRARGLVDRAPGRERAVAAGRRGRRAPPGRDG